MVFFYFSLSTNKVINTEEFPEKQIHLVADPNPYPNLSFCRIRFQMKIADSDSEIVFN
jgi:hypothetical protein